MCDMGQSIIFCSLHTVLKYLEAEKFEKLTYSFPPWTSSSVVPNIHSSVHPD